MRVRKREKERERETGMTREREREAVVSEQAIGWVSESMQVLCDVIAMFDIMMLIKS
jgi:hypothetical protein